MKPLESDAKCNQASTLEQDHLRFVHGFAQIGPKLAFGSPTPARSTDPDLARILEAWPLLPEHIRRAILALVGTAR
jgi:hypothetical protein